MSDLESEGSLSKRSDKEKEAGFSLQSHGAIQNTWSGGVDVIDSDISEGSRAQEDRCIAVVADAWFGQQMVDLFKANDINGYKLLLLSERTLHAMGIDDEIH
ncbi:hypothetical protein BC829DRAFT_446846 [Chytridium lagenaria]|nr:hypothetical protein BC829DRAFT_446846 [Chytridium lagenaria]